MSKPERQHFIPRSYLKNFSDNIEKKYFIYGRRLNNTEVRKLSTKDICLSVNLYTIPTKDDSKKYLIEHFYAENVDSVYPEVYDILTDDNIQNIDFNSRLKIINTCLALYFRTPKFLNLQNKLYEQMCKDLAAISNDDIVSYKFLGEEISFNKSEIEQMIKEKKENNRQLFLYQHIKAYEKLVQVKLKDDLCVHKVIGNSELITCDNPVIIRTFVNPLDLDFDDKLLNREIDPFDGNNMIHLPLNKKCFLTIMPKSEEFSLDTIQRLTATEVDILILNSDIEKYSEDWILGSEKGINEYLDNILKFKEETPENIDFTNDYISLVKELNTLSELIDKYGFNHEQTLNKIEEMKNNPKIMEDSNFKNILNKIEKKPPT